MNEYAKLNAIYTAIYSAKDIIETLDRPAGKYGFDDFETPELRDMFYDLNHMNLKLTKMIDAHKAKLADS